MSATLARTYLDAIRDAIAHPSSVEPDAFISLVAVAAKHLKALQRNRAREYDDAEYELGNLLVKAKEMVRRIKVHRKTGKWPTPSRSTAWKLR